MKLLELKNKNLDYREYIKRSAQESDYTELVEESVIATENGEIKFIYQELDFDCSDIIEALRRIRYTESKRTDGLKTRSRTFGFLPRLKLRRDFCTSTSLASEFPTEHSVVCEYARKIEAIYRAANPSGFIQHQQESEKFRKNYRLGGETIFTSGIINKNNPLKYHFDTGNLKKVYSCMLVFKQDIKGGYLSLPEYGLGVQLKNNSIFMFDGQGIMHGVTPIVYSHQHSFRYSVVYYSMRDIWKCLEIDDELARIRNDKRQRELKRAHMTPEDKAEYRRLYSRRSTDGRIRKSVAVEKGNYQQKT